MSVEVRTMKGIVVDTAVLGVRKEPKPVSEIIVIVLEKAEVAIDSLFVDPVWYRVETNTGDIGYAPKNFIAIKKG